MSLLARNWRAGAAFLAAGLASCVTQSGVVVLLPEKDGRDTALTIQQGEDKVVLDRPYGAANLTSWGRASTRARSRRRSVALGEALAAQPARATSFTLYFVTGTDELTDDSKAMLENVLSALSRYPIADVLVVGHTDSGHRRRQRPALSKRAEAVRALLIGAASRRTVSSPSDAASASRSSRPPTALRNLAIGVRRSSSANPRRGPLPPAGAGA